jgi:hypothetical protein
MGGCHEFVLLFYKAAFKMECDEAENICENGCSFALYAPPGEFE